MPYSYRWDDIQVFAAIVEEGNMTRAAEALGVTQATISRRLGALEDALGGALFARTPGGVVLTPLGEALQPRAEAMVRAAAGLGDLAEDVTGEPRGLVRLALPDDTAAFVVVPLLEPFFARHPKVRLELMAGVALSDMTRMEADLAMRLVRPTQGEHLRVVRMGAFTFGVYATRAYLDRVGEWGSPEELEWVDWSDALAHIPEARWRRENVPEATVRVSASTMTARRQAVLHGLGVGVLPRGMAARFDALVEVEWAWPEFPEVQMWLVANEATRSTARVSAVWDFILEITQSM
jgi:DNA-binding transcriptional LysR family regulator